MGYEYGDAQNIAVRVFLNQFSKNFNYFDEIYLKKTLEYFDYKCPYTGEDISDRNYVKDHIVPINRECCGLHVFGNVLPVTRKANSDKGAQSLEQFLQEKPEKLIKINQFIKESGYLDIQEKYGKQLKLNCEALYQNIGKIIKESYDDFANILDLKRNPNNIELIKTAKTYIYKKENITEKKVYISQKTNIPNDIQLKLVCQDKKNNRFYIYPRDEIQFKEEAYKNRQIAVKVFYPDGTEEILRRTVTKIWDTSVAWNINSMPGRNLKHLNSGSNVTAFACPIQYRAILDKIEKGSS